MLSKQDLWPLGGFEQSDNEKDFPVFQSVAS
jgi:hypothetical protein